MTFDSRLMIVDDDHFSAMYMQQVLSKQRLHVTAVPTANQACAQLRAHPADLVLLDVTLPDASGFAVCQWLRQTYADVGIIFVSGHTALADRLQAFEVGADDFLGKPFLTAELVARVRAVLRRRGTEAHSEQAREGDRTWQAREGDRTWQAREGDRTWQAREGDRTWQARERLNPLARKTNPSGLGMGETIAVAQNDTVQTAGCALALAGQRLALPDGTQVALSALEAQLLALLMARPGQLVLRADLARHVWSAERNPSLTAQRAIEAHLWRLVARIEPDPQWARYVQVIRHLGARFIARAT